MMHCFNEQGCPQKISIAVFLAILGQKKSIVVFLAMVRMWRTNKVENRWEKKKIKVGKENSWGGGGGGGEGGEWRKKKLKSSTRGVCTEEH